MIQYLYIIATAYFIADISTLQKKIAFRWKKAFNVKRFRPFDCAYCMGFWITFLYLCFKKQFGIEMIGISLTVALCSGLVSLIIKKIAS